MTAAVMLQACDPFRSGKLVLYQVQYSSGWHAFELVPFALLGIMGVSCAEALPPPSPLHTPQRTCLHSHTGRLRRALHPGEHAGRAVEEDGNVAAGAGDAGGRGGAADGAHQLPQPVHARAVVGAGVEPVHRVLQAAGRPVRALQHGGP